MAGEHLPAPLSLPSQVKTRDPDPGGFLPRSVLRETTGSDLRETGPGSDLRQNNRIWKRILPSFKIRIRILPTKHPDPDPKPRRKPRREKFILHKISNILFVFGTNFTVTVFTVNVDLVNQRIIVILTDKLSFFLVTDRLCMFSVVHCFAPMDSLYFCHCVCNCIHESFNTYHIGVKYSLIVYGVEGQFDSCF